MKIAAVVILYNPEELVWKNIRSYADMVERVYIIDNSEIHGSYINSRVSEITNAEYFQDGQNLGIAARLNFAAKKALESGYEYILTMDQDSSFSSISIEQYLKCVKQFKDAGKVSMFGVNYIDKIETDNDCSWIKVNQLITSGSILNLSVFKQLNGFDESLFIDEVDLEYCYHSIKRGFDCIQFLNIHMEHSLGTTSQFRSIKSLQKTPRALHSPVRVYYMVRNFLYVNDKYKSDFAADKKRRKAALLNRLKNNILYQKDRIGVVKMILKGYRDYKSNKMGKIQYK